MTTAIFVWLAATAGLVLLSTRAARRSLPADATPDERIFVAVVMTISTLAASIHAASITTGLTLVTGILWLAGVHGVVWGLVRARQATETTASQLTMRERVAVAMWMAIALSWIDASTLAADIHGADAAHYHVPHALNLAAGASPFDLPATPHLYPMAASAVSAWFILPLGTPLMVDLAMLLAFTLIGASMNLIFRATTGQSGLVWSSWLVLALFATPMFRASSAGSADLWFAAGFVAVVAALAQAWARGGWRGIDVIVAGAALGVLLGSKTTGAPAAALLLAAYAAIAGVRRVAGAPALWWPNRPMAATGLGAVALLGAGGVWLVRNWWQFGSPVAPSGLALFGVTLFDGDPFQRTSYLSVLGELGTDTFSLWSRTRHFVTQWFGPAYLPALWLVVLPVIDIATGVARRAADQTMGVRVGVMALIVGVSAALLWLLVGAPWTALDRSGGLTLRYALPVAALLPLVGFIGLFPLSWRWYGRPSWWRNLAWVAGITASVWCFRGALATGPLSAFGLPALKLTWLVVAVVVGGAAGILRHFNIRGEGVSRKRRWQGAGVVVVVLACVFAAQVIARREAGQLQAAQVAFEAEEAAFAAGQPAASGWREALFAVRAAERADGRRCETRRFFALTRNDEPLALQTPEFGSLVFYAGRDVEATQRVGPIGVCDYVVTTVALDGTEKGRALAAALGADVTSAGIATSRFRLLGPGPGR